MALLSPARLSSRRLPTAHLILGAFLLSFVAVEVIDIDDSNRPTATRAAATALEECRLGGGERLEAQRPLASSASTIPLPEDVASLGPSRGPSSSIRPLPSFPLQGVHSALPRATLADSHPLI
jgi:hypothetical protein